MKNLLIGMAVGVVTGYVLRKLEDDGKFDCLYDHLHGMAAKAKREAKNVADRGWNEVEHAAERVEQFAEKEKNKKN